MSCHYVIFSDGKYPYYVYFSEGIDCLHSTVNGVHLQMVEAVLELVSHTLRLRTMWPHLLDSPDTEDPRQCMCRTCF